MTKATGIHIGSFCCLRVVLLPFVSFCRRYSMWLFSTNKIYLTFPTGYLGAFSAKVLITKRKTLRGRL